MKEVFGEVEDLEAAAEADQFLAVLVRADQDIVMEPIVDLVMVSYIKFKK